MDYAGQDIQGCNAFGCPFVDQTLADAVQTEPADYTPPADDVPGSVLDYDAILAALGFASIAELLAATDITPA